MYSQPYFSAETIKMNSRNLELILMVVLKLYTCMNITSYYSVLQAWYYIVHGTTWDYTGFLMAALDHPVLSTQNATTVTYMEKKHISS